MSTSGSMTLRVVLPYRLFGEWSAVTRIVVEARGGSFGILPHRRDIVAGIIPGILTFEDGGAEQFLALDEGILVKRGEWVQVTVRDAISGAGLGALKQAIMERFGHLDRREQVLRTALARLESHLVRGMWRTIHE